MSSSPEPLFIDLETYSSVDITSCGVFRYTESDDFEILLLAYAYGHGPVRVLDLNNPDDAEPLRKIYADIVSPERIKVAHNCAFERCCLSEHLRVEMPIEQWEDTMILAAMNGLPMSLDAVGEALNLTERKIKEGTSLITYFCKPRPKRANSSQITLTQLPPRRQPEENPEKWERFKEYCKRDVEVEQTVYYRLKKNTKITVPERKLFEADSRINERGVRIDTELAEAAVAVGEEITAKATAEMKNLTGLSNPNSVAQLKEWLAVRGVETGALDKAAVKELLDTVTDPTVRRVLELRQQLGKTSTSKYDAMLRSACFDDRVRGITQFYGAGRTGRWAGRLVQLQNLPQNHLEDIAVVREIVRSRDTELLEMLYPSVPDVLSQLIRTALVAAPERVFLVADYSAIEARVTAYLAGVKWRMDTFARGGDIYCQSASQMFGVPVEKHGVNSHLRQKGKVAELACGYGGGVGALRAFGADKMGLTEEEMQSIVNQWRAASPEIPKMWRDVEDRAVSALNNPGRTYTLYRKEYDPERARLNEGLTGGIGFSDYFKADSIICRFKRDGDALRCLLPSGRKLTYWGAKLDSDGHIVYMSQNQTTRKWEKAETWGGKLVENIVQAFSRDCLGAAIIRLEKAGYNICFHVHDEIIAEAHLGARWQDMAKIMSEPLSWAPGLLLTADGYATPFYLKD